MHTLSSGQEHTYEVSTHSHSHNFVAPTGGASFPRLQPVAHHAIAPHQGRSHMGFPVKNVSNHLLTGFERNVVNGAGRRKSIDSTAPSLLPNASNIPEQPWHAHAPSPRLLTPSLLPTTIKRSKCSVLRITLVSRCTCFAVDVC